MPYEIKDSLGVGIAKFILFRPCATWVLLELNVGVVDHLSPGTCLNDRQLCGNVVSFCEKCNLRSTASDSPGFGRVHSFGDITVDDCRPHRKAHCK